jgi:hypothetical protein
MMQTTINRQAVLNSGYPLDGTAKEVIPIGSLVETGVDVGGNTEELMTTTQTLVRIADVKPLEEMGEFNSGYEDYAVGDKLSSIVPQTGKVYSVRVNHTGALGLGTKLKLSATAGVLDDAGVIDATTILGTVKFQSFKAETFDGGGETKRIDCLYIGQ